MLSQILCLTLIIILLAVSGNDTVIGDPLFEADLWFANETREFSYSLCYEIHGRSNRHFNLISDTCVSVNAYYIAMNDPMNGNIISAFGIRAVDNSGSSCTNIEVSQNQTTGYCELRVNGVQTPAYSMNGISATLRSSYKARVSVPNCEQLPLVMWIKCRNVQDQFMMRFDIMRGVNLRPTSHGLLGNLL